VAAALEVIELTCHLIFGYSESLQYGLQPQYSVAVLRVLFGPFENSTNELDGDDAGFDTMASKSQDGREVLLEAV